MASVNKVILDIQRIINNCTVDKNTGCWNWNLSKQKNRYGQMKHDGKMKRAHRGSYVAFRGEILDGLEVMHDCDNRACVNPWHLIAGTHQENMKALSLRGKRGEEHPLFGRKQPKGSYKNQSIEIQIDGKEYESMNEAERAMNVSHGSARYWLKNGRAQISKGTNHG